MNLSVSIVIPCYNAAPFLREALDSTLRQTVPAAEVILVDDGSTDDSAAIAESYGPPVRVIRQANQGVFVILPRDQAPGVSEESQMQKVVRVVATVDYYLR